MTSPTTAPAKPRLARTLTVLRTERLTPHLIRVTAGGRDLASLPDNGFSDAYVKLLFFPGPVPEGPVDVAALREQEPPEHWPITRTYTIRSVDRAAGELVIDFVHHGDVGLAGPWAASARPGTTFHFLGPGGAYAPDPAADWHLFAGDESALPAISAALERLPAHARAVAVLEVADARERLPLRTEATIEVHWVERELGGSLVEAVAALPFPAGDVHAFVHGETGAVKLLRRHLLTERGIPRERLSISGYWRRGMNEDAFQAAKRTDPID